MRVRATPVLDEVIRGKEAVVLVDGQILRVSALAHSLRALAPDWTELAVVAQGLTMQHGEPDGDPQELLAPVVADMVDAGLLLVEDESGPD